MNNFWKWQISKAGDNIILLYEIIKNKCRYDIQDFDLPTSTAVIILCSPISTLAYYDNEMDACIRYVNSNS